MRGAALPIRGGSRRVLFDARPMGPVPAPEGKTTLKGGATGKVAVFGMLKRDGKVFTIVVDDTKSNT